MEQGLCSSKSEFVALSPKFVCVRLYYTVKGASEPFVKFGLGSPKGPRNNVDLAFLAPDGRNIDVRTLKPVSGPETAGLWVRDIVAVEKNQAGDGKEIIQKAIELMREISKLYPGKRDAPAVPWQVSLGHAVFVSAWDSQMARQGGPREVRRMVIASAPGGSVQPALESALEDPELLRKYEPYYVFARLDPKEAPPELAEALERAGPAGLVVLEAARSVNGFGQNQDLTPRLYPKLLEARPGPHTKASVGALLAKHAVPHEPPRKNGAR
ncbi:MAG TPA: thioredoxin family protein [Planctomycetota bacterium]|nr:thioredoxin family protein [Planctomycetota bacterium]